MEKGFTHANQNLFFVVWILKEHWEVGDRKLKAQNPPPDPVDAAIWVKASDISTITFDTAGEHHPVCGPNWETLGVKAAINGTLARLHVSVPCLLRGPGALCTGSSGVLDSLGPGVHRHGLHDWQARNSPRER